MAGLFQDPPKHADMLEEKTGKVGIQWWSWFSKLVQNLNAINLGIINQPTQLKKFLAGPISGADAIPGFRTIAATDLPGLTAVIITAPLTGIGTPGSMTFTNGLLTAQTPAT